MILKKLYTRIKSKIKLYVNTKKIKESGLFDEGYYMHRYDDVAKGSVPPLKHFMQFGAKEGRDPSDRFDMQFYLQAYPDVAASDINPLLHYIQHGKAEGRKCIEHEPTPLTPQRSATLIFDHNGGGGTWTYVYHKLINTSSSRNDPVLLARYDSVRGYFKVEVRQDSKIVERSFYKDYNVFTTELSKSQFNAIVVNHLVSWPSVKAVLHWVAAYKKSNPSVEVSFKGHDYYSVCPSYTLQDESHRYCGIRNDETGCNACVHALRGQHCFLDEDNTEYYSTANWRATWGSFFAETADVIDVFSPSSLKIFSQAYPKATHKMNLVPHEVPSFECYNVAILGHLVSHKGSKVVKQFCRFMDDNAIEDIQLYLFGLNGEGIKSRHLKETGPYERHDLPEKLKQHKIDLVFIPSTCPETFCYTAGEAIALDYPVACFDLGGQADQVRNSTKGIILHNEEPAYLYNTIKRVCAELKTAAGTNESEPDTPTKTVILQDHAGREFLNWMYARRDDKTHYISEAEDDIVRTEKMPKVIAFYLPQFHDFEENVKWFGRGFSEWTNTSQTLPQFIGHNQPHVPIDVGYYTLNDNTAMYRQAELARKYGISGFCMYYYWFSGAKLMDQPLKRLLGDKNLDFPFFFFWANEHWTRLWGNGADREVLHKMELLPGDAEHFMEDVLPYMRDPRYIKINNKPMLIIYKLKIFPKKDYLNFVSTIQRIAKENGFDGIYLSGIIEEWMDVNELSNIQSEYHLDALTEFSSVFGRTGWKFKEEEAFDPACKSVQYDVDDYVRNRKYLRDTDANVFAGLFPSWDNTPRRYNRGASILQSTPENYKQWLSDLIQWTMKHHVSDEQFIFVNAWNEWAESAHLEPDTYYGYSYLQKTREALEEAFCQDQSAN